MAIMGPDEAIPSISQEMRPQRFNKLAHAGTTPEKAMQMHFLVNRALKSRSWRFFFSGMAINIFDATTTNVRNSPDIDLIGRPTPARWVLCPAKADRAHAVWTFQPVVLPANTTNFTITRRRRIHKPIQVHSHGCTLWRGA